MKYRCEWAGSDPLSMDYHDNEWGVPAHDDRHLFEMLVLEGAQAGLSWLTILRKRESYRNAFDHFDIGKVAAYSEKDVQRLLADSGIVRNRLKIESAVSNARGVLAMQQEFGSFDAFCWRFVDSSPEQKEWNSQAAVPAWTEKSDMMSRELKKRGFKFVGSTICYAFMQAVGIVNDHIMTCFRRKEVKKMARPDNKYSLRSALLI
ncbi:MAG TPA: DNA-3-methyladenine glycosylase I [Dissulfurispiraceae bacterium]|nr:DNA-3-methyladenine glycosylase I [Dissulfurispiraceae bacterium]